MLGRCGQVYLEILEESGPEEFRRLKIQGQLNAMASQEEERGQLLFAYHRAALLREQPAPKGYIGRVQYLQVIENQATELALEDIVVRPDPDAPDPDLLPSGEC